MVAGYRVVRRLGAGTRSIVYLGHAGSGAGTHAGAGSIPDAATVAGMVAIKVFAADADERTIEQTVNALGTLTATHPGRLPGLLDLATLPDGRVALVLERLGGGSLTDLLRARRRIEPGEAVTILAPVTAALGALHASGFAHDTLSQSSVLFDESGRPVLCGLGGLRALPPFAASGSIASGSTASGGAAAGGVAGPRDPAGAPSVGPGPRARLDCVRDDYARLTVLLRSVFDHLDPGSPVSRRAEPLAAWFEIAAATIPFEPRLEQLERRLFEWAPGCPVRFPAAAAADAQSEVAAPGLVGGAVVIRAAAAGAGAAGVVEADVVEAGGHSGRRAHRRPPGLGRSGDLHLPPEVSALAPTVLDGNPAMVFVEWGRKWVRERMRGRRRPLTIAACLGGAVVVAALTVIPQQAGPNGPSGARDGGLGQPGGSGAPARDGPTAGSSAGAVRVTEADRAAITGDDPVLAVPALLRLRAQCLEAASVICLEGADQAGSVALATDGYAVRMVQQGSPPVAAPDWDSHHASLAERTGGSALVTLTPGQNDPQREPASLLVVKGEAGWRLREIFER
jgi:Protein tyrosine and serine/threonine kinase